LERKLGDKKDKSAKRSERKGRDASPAIKGVSILLVQKCLRRKHVTRKTSIVFDRGINRREGGRKF